MDRLRNFGFLIKDVSRLSSKNFERHAVGLNLTLAQCKVLVNLERNEGISQARLADLTDTDPMTLVRILDRMERDGWIERRAHPNDRRARQLYLKAEAMPVLNEIWRFSDRARADALSDLSAAERDQLVNLLGRIHANLIAVIPAAVDSENQTIRKPAIAAIQAADSAVATTPIPPSHRAGRSKDKDMKGTR